MPFSYTLRYNSIDGYPVSSNAIRSCVIGFDMVEDGVTAIR